MTASPGTNAVRHHWMWPAARQLPAATLDCSCHGERLLQENTFRWHGGPPLSPVVIAYLPWLCDHSFVVNNCQYHTAEWVRAPGLWIINNLLSDLSFSLFRISSLALFPPELNQTPEFCLYTRIWPDSKVQLLPCLTLFLVMRSMLLGTQNNCTSGFFRFPYWRSSENYLPN